jgi:DNA-binding NarL/FixJ family response regulator
LALLNDYEIVVAGLEHMLAPFSDRVLVLAQELGQPEPQLVDVDVALLDMYAMPHTGYERIQLLSEDPRVRAVAVFTFDTEQRRVGEALARGATGYLSKTTTAEQLIEDLERVARGDLVINVPSGTDGDNPPAGPAWPGSDLGLTERESHILAMLTTGLRNAEIADALYVSIDTVKTHLRSVFRKLGVRNRAEAVAVALGNESFRRSRPNGLP